MVLKAAGFIYITNYPKLHVKVLISATDLSRNMPSYVAKKKKKK